MYKVEQAAIRSPRVPVPAQAMRDNIEFWSEEYPAILRRRAQHFDHGQRDAGQIQAWQAAAGFLRGDYSGSRTQPPWAVTLLAMPTNTCNEDGVIASNCSNICGSGSAGTQCTG